MPLVKPSPKVAFGSAVLLDLEIKEKPDPLIHKAIEDTDTVVTHLHTLVRSTLES